MTELRKLLDELIDKIAIEIKKISHVIYTSFSYELKYMKFVILQTKNVMIRRTSKNSLKLLSILLMITS